RWPRAVLDGYVNAAPPLGLRSPGLTGVVRSALRAVVVRSIPAGFCGLVEGPRERGAAVGGSMPLSALREGSRVGPAGAGPGHTAQTSTSTGMIIGRRR